MKKQIGHYEAELQELHIKFKEQENQRFNPEYFGSEDNVKNSIEDGVGSSPF